MRQSMVAGLAALLLLTACAPALDLSPLEGRVTTLETKTEDFAALDQRVTALEQQSETDMHAVNPFDVAVAQYILDTAGFHAMAETLAETKKAEPAYLSAVNRVHSVLSNAPWPDELSEQGQAFVALLAKLAAALEADDGDESARLADGVHEAQHDLSHALSEWLGAGGDGH